jgi:hypothetical protein
MTKNFKTLAIGASVASFAVCSGLAQGGGLAAWGMEKGDWEFTLGGGGQSSKDFDANAGSFNASVGYFLSNHFEVGLRQDLSFAAGDDGGSTVAATRAFLDFHFKLGQKWRPYIGAAIGGVYGDDVNESFTGGFEAGLKYYVLPKTFLFGHFEYQWSFDDGDDIDDTFDDGSFLYKVGVGFNF